ncbi:Sal family ABC-F type ribosomal protection protein [Staphylococcus equorum]|uniref:Sal family ABC-F type ribosomal protection protein n=2 Tax=Staphylococcus equorum TaxID=246432 RepID=UPI0021BFFE48|nr:Sal family ABC-F type ribosomal protection protein [Staphylococcus equorum]
MACHILGSEEIDMSFYYVQKPFEKYGKTLINHVNISVEIGEHIALVGDNGVGKTTLLSELYLKYRDNAYLMTQDMTDYYNETGMEFVLSLFPEILKLKKEITYNYEKIADYIAYNGYEVEQKIITQANLFNLTETDLDKQMGLLSGGQQTRVALLRSIISEKDLILLDEPTNHLDQTMLNDLITHMNKSKCTIIYVSHHRGFINATASHIIEINRTQTRKFTGNYNQYKEIIDLEFQTQVNAYEKQQKEVKKLEDTIKRVKEWHAASKQTTSVRDPSMQKRLSKLAQKSKVKESQLNQKLNEKNIEEPEKDNRKFRFEHHEKKRKRYLLRLEDFSISINDLCIYNQANFEIKNNENILLTGPNGSGKSLLINLIRQKIKPDQGFIHITPSLKIGYFDQQNNNLTYRETPLNTLLALEGMTRSQAQTILAAFGFDQDKIIEPVAYLSMGEKSRLQFVLLFFSNPNLLILDEPTNYFDITTQDLIMDMIHSFSGQVLIVTHDQYLQSRFTATHWEVSNKQLHNLTLNQYRKTNTVDTLKLLDDYKTIDESGHFETEN